MDYETFSACMEQKIVLLKRIRQLSKEIELHCGEPDRDPSELPGERQIFFDRLKKCEALLSAQIGRQLPEDRERLRKVFAEGGRDSAQGPQELALYESGVTCRTLLRDILAMDSVSIQRMKTERNRLKELLHQKKQSGDGKLSFYPLR